MNNQNSQIRLEAVLNTLVDGVVIIDENGSMQRFNPACERIFGYKSKDVIGKNVKMLMPLPDQNNHDDYIQSYRKTGVRKIIGIGREVSGLRRDGSVFPMDLAVGETEVDGKVIFVGIIRDLTETYKQKQKFDELQEQHFHLSRIAAMNEMGSAIAHEINQPMAAAVNYMETVKILLGNKDAIETEKLSTILMQAIEQTQRASEIITRMRGFVERGDVEKAPESIAVIIDTAKRLTLRAFNEQNIEVITDIPPSMPDVLANAVQIQQVVVNLIRNAGEAMMDSQVKRLGISAKTTADNYWIEVIVSDTGHGLSECDIENLFVPFSTKKKGGMGVGLSISQSIISHHEGQLWASYNEPQGSQFHFTLPIAKAYASGGDS